MESDSKDGKGKSTVAAVDPVEKKVLFASKRSGRKNKKTVEDKEKTNEEVNNKTKEIYLTPKFPSHTSLGKVPLKDDSELNQPDPVIFQDEENGLTMETEREKANNHWEEGERELVVDEVHEEEIEQRKEMQEIAHASASESKGKIEAPPEKPFEKEKQEKRGEKKVEKASTRDKKSGRSEDRKKLKKENMSSDEKKSAEDKKRTDVTMLKKKQSAEDLNSDEVRKSGRRSKRMKKTNFKPMRPGQQPTQGGQSGQQPVQLQPKTDRSLKLRVDENKFNDDKGKKGMPQRNPKKDVVGGQQQKAPLPPAKSPLPGGTVYVAPELLKQQLQQQSQQQQMNSSQQVQPTDKKSKFSFIKTVMKKTRFWKDKGSTNPPSEVNKTYVKAEYDPFDSNEFLPDFRKLLPEEEWKCREFNLNCSKEKIFINKRPFWLNRKSSEQLPKVRIQLHLPLKQAFEGNPGAILPKMSRTEPFCDPRKDPLEKMKAIDATIGVDLNYVAKDPMNVKNEQKEKELNRVCANTFHATVMFEQQKLVHDSKRKKSELEGKMETARRGKREKPQKSSFEDGKETNSKKNVSFSVPVDPVLVVYNRKHRPRTFHPPIGTVGETRKVHQVKYKFVGRSAKDKKPRAPSPCSGTSPSSAVSNSVPSSSSQSSSAEGKKN